MLTLIERNNIIFRINTWTFLFIIIHYPNIESLDFPIVIYATVIGIIDGREKVLIYNSRFPPGYFQRNNPRRCAVNVLKLLFTEGTANADEIWLNQNTHIGRADLGNTSVFVIIRCRAS